MSLPLAYETSRIEADGASLECFLVPWDSTIFGFPVAQVQRLDLAPHGGSEELFRSFDAWCSERGVRLASCRLDHDRLRDSMALEEHGFRFVEMVYEPRFEAFETIAQPDRRIDVADVTDADLAGVEAIAYSAFSTGRFLLDRRLPPDLSRRRYATWVRNSLGSSDQAVLKAEVDGELIGFFIVERQADDRVFWHLTAVDPQWQGKGLGLSLWRTMLLRHRAEGATGVWTTISGHNLPAMNLYARLGFRFDAARMTFHRILGEADRTAAEGSA